MSGDRSWTGQAANSHAPQPPLPFDPGLLHLASDLRQRGIEPRRGDFTSIRHGVWIATPRLRDLTAEQRHAALVHATALQMRMAEPVFARASAAALWGMPRIGTPPRVVDVHVEGQRLRGSRFLRFHPGEHTTAVLVNGVFVTPAARTVIDLARADALEQAIAAADHALRFALCTRQELLEEVERIPRRGHGRPAAKLVAVLADPGSMSAGESLSRTQMFLLDLPRPRLQVPHEDDRGLIGVVDFDWDGVIGEFDGRSKYRIPSDAGPDVAAEILWREKQREDRLRRMTGHPVARWTWAVARNRDALASILATVGIRPQPRNTWIDLAPFQRTA